VKPLQRKPAYDIIGDIHGCASELETLLRELGYRELGSHYLHADGRKVVFLGDYIDRGPEVRRTLQVVRGMIDGGTALGILGNHEINALRYHQKGIDEEWLRPHTQSKTHQHQATLDQLALRHPAEWRDWLNWFAKLPLFLEPDGFRAVHAAWFDHDIESISGHSRLSGKELVRFSDKGSIEEVAIERLLCGLELKLPEGEYFSTPDGATRGEIRAKWWEDLQGRNCREAVFPEDPTISTGDCLVPGWHMPYSKTSKPVFFGHFALKEENPSPLAQNVACLDYGGGKGGRIGAYRWDGEAILDPTKFYLSPSTAEH